MICNDENYMDFVDLPMFLFHSYRFESGTRKVFGKIVR